MSSDLKPAEAWFAWTENPIAISRRNCRHSARRRKARSAPRRSARHREGRGGATIGSRVNALLEFAGGLAAAPGKRPRTAWRGPKPSGRRGLLFLSGQPPHAIPGVANVRVYVLGPPHERKRIKQSDPSRGRARSRCWRRGGGVRIDGSHRGAGRVRPPPRILSTLVQRQRRGSSAAELYQKRMGLPRTTDAWRRIEDDWLGAAGSLALQLDSDTNNTSLALAFELFAPDAFCSFRAMRK